MENYHLISQWAANLKADKAFKEILDLKAKYRWIECPESIAFITKMYEDLPRILHIIKLQEAQNVVLRRSDENLRSYIKANQLADECILDDIKKKFNVDI
jgi:hypothetical protein